MSSAEKDILGGFRLNDIYSNSWSILKNFDSVISLNLGKLSQCVEAGKKTVLSHDSKLYRLMLMFLMLVLYQEHSFSLMFFLLIFIYPYKSILFAHSYKKIQLSYV